MNNRYYYFVVNADFQPWPFFIEIPYSAWPTETLAYNSNGNCNSVYDREWSYLDVMHWDTHENLTVWNAGLFEPANAENLRQHMEEMIGWGEGLLSPAPIGRIGLYLLETIPEAYCVSGNVVIASLNCRQPDLVAAVSRLFMRRLASEGVWDGQTDNLLTLPELVGHYLQEFPLSRSDTLADEARSLFTQVEAWHRVHPNEQTDWLKTLDQARNFLKSRIDLRTDDA